MKQGKTKHLYLFLFKMYLKILYIYAMYLDHIESSPLLGLPSHPTVNFTSSFYKFYVYLVIIFIHSFINSLCLISVSHMAMGIG